MEIESLYHRWREDRITANFTNKLHRVFNRLLAAHAIRCSTERKIERQALEETHDARSLVDADTRQLANTNTRVGERCDLRTRQKVETVLVVILVYKNLRRLFWRDRLLDVVGEHLPEGEIGSD